MMGDEGDLGPVRQAPLPMAKGLQPKGKREPRFMRVQVRDDQGRYIAEWMVEVMPSGEDRVDAKTAVRHLRDLMVWGPWPTDGEEDT